MDILYLHVKTPENPPLKLTCRYKIYGKFRLLSSANPWQKENYPTTKNIFRNKKSAKYILVVRKEQ